MCWLPVPVVLVTAVHPAHGVALRGHHVLLEQFLQTRYQGSNQNHNLPSKIDSLIHYVSEQVLIIKFQVSSLPRRSVWCCSARAPLRPPTQITAELELSLLRQGLVSEHSSGSSRNILNESRCGIFVTLLLPLRNVVASCKTTPCPSSYCPPGQSFWLEG